jgi:hypothetical protein
VDCSTLKRKEKRKNTGSVNTTMDKERMLFCVLHYPMDAEPHDIPSDE